MSKFKACRAHGCCEIINAETNYCERHTKQNQKNKIKRVYDHHAIYNTSAWKMLSQQKRSKNPFCEICGEVADVVDHIIEVKDNDSVGLLEENLQSLCHSCHNRKTARAKGARNKNKIEWFYKCYLIEIDKTDPRKLI